MSIIIDEHKNLIVLLKNLGFTFGFLNGFVYHKTVNKTEYSFKIVNTSLLTKIKVVHTFPFHASPDGIKATTLDVQVDEKEAIKYLNEFFPIEMRKIKISKLLCQKK